MNKKEREIMKNALRHWLNKSESNTKLETKKQKELINAKEKSEKPD